MLHGVASISRPLNDVHTGTLETFVSKHVEEEHRASVLRAFENEDIRNFETLKWLDHQWFIQHIPAPAGEQIWLALMVRCSDVHDANVALTRTNAPSRAQWLWWVCV